jgi:hypothetical protein
VEAGAIRAMLIEGLEAGGIWQASRVGVRERFLGGELDLTFAELELDSLARMELCIAIEVGTGVSLAPEELDPHVSLAPLVAEIERRTHA